MHRNATAIECVLLLYVTQTSSLICTGIETDLIVNMYRRGIMGDMLLLVLKPEYVHDRNHKKGLYRRHHYYPHPAPRLPPVVCVCVCDLHEREREGKGLEREGERDRESERD